MRIVNLSVSGFKEVEVDLTWAPAIVFFGPNDAGKTNLLEALESVLGTDDSPIRRDPGNKASQQFGFDTEHVVMEATVELEGLDFVGSNDWQFLHDGLLEGIARPESEVGEDFHFWPLGELSDDVLPEEMRASLDALRHFVAQFIVFVGLEDCGDQDAVRGDYQKVIEACVASPLVRLEWEFVAWLAPDPSTWRGGLRQAARRLAQRRDLWESGAVPFVDPLLDGKRLPRPHSFLRFGSDVSPTLIEGLGAFVRVVSADEASGLPGEIEEFIEKRSKVHVLRGKDELVLVGTADAWLKRKGDLEGIDPRIKTACTELSSRATELAPSFVAAAYDIVIRPLLGSERPAFEGHRVQIGVRSKVTNQVFDLAVTGSGVSTWARYSIREAMRTLAKAPAEAGEQEPSTFYVLDEPERHLHPAAQVEIADWVSRRIEDGAGAIIATHALPFLDLAYLGTEYHRVFRDAEGRTRAARLTHDAIGLLDRAVKEVGLASRTQLIQLTRAVLIVEGEHDQVVIEKFAGKELRRSRTWILPLRGARNASGAPGLELLRRLDVPLFVLFDNVTARAINDARDLRSDSLEEREIKQMFREWPQDRPKPTVLPYKEPDIICALPASAVEEVMTQHRLRAAFPGWRSIVSDFRALPPRDRRDFKGFASSQTGLTFDTTTIRKILSRSGSLAPDSPLYRPLQELLAHTGNTPE